MGNKKKKKKEARMQRKRRKKEDLIPKTGMENLKHIHPG